MPSLPKKSELAIVSYLSSMAITPNIFAGESTQVKEYPEIIVSCEQGEEDPPLSGNYWLDTRVTLRSNSAFDESGVDPAIQHDILADLVFQAMASTTLSAQLTALGVAIGFNGQLPFRLTNSPSTDRLESIVEGRLMAGGAITP